MFKFKNDITICVNEEYAVTMQEFIRNDLGVKGHLHIYISEDKFYIGFTTKHSTAKIRKIMREKLYKVNMKIVGGTVFATFE